MKRYLGILKNEFMSYLSYREHFITSIIGTFTFYFVLYFLWKAIFAGSSGEIKGMTFEQTFVYLVLASCFFKCMSNGIEWDMYFEIIKGDIVIPMVRPMDYQKTIMAKKAAYSLTDFVFFAVPTYIVLFIIFPQIVSVGIHSLIFLVCLTLSFVVMFAIEFIIGTVSFYTESVWGISMIKETVISFFAGVTIPLQMFPEKLKRIADILPFKSIYQDPLSILLNSNTDIMQALKVIAFQFMWMIIILFISRIIYKTMINKLVVNGG